MNRTTFARLLSDLTNIYRYSNDAELAEVGQLLVNGGNDVAISIGEIAHAVLDRITSDAPNASMEEGDG